MSDGKDNNINLTILNEISKAAKTGRDDVDYVLEKVCDENMRQSLSSEYDEYNKIVQRVNNEFNKYGETPDDQPMMTKMMGWTGIQLNTLTNKSNSHIAQLIIQGNDMGIVKCQKLLNHNPKADESVKNILTDFITMQQHNIEKMKTFL